MNLGDGWKEVQERSNMAYEIIMDMVKNTEDEQEEVRLKGKAEGIKLVLEYMDKFERDLFGKIKW